MTDQQFGILIGIAILLFLLRVLFVLLFSMLHIIEKIVTYPFRNTIHEENISKFFRILGNVVERGKLSDPKEDLYRDIKWW